MNRVSERQTGPTSSQRASAGSSPALFPPPPGIDPDWRERIEIAKRCREETRKARGNKSSTFDMHGPPMQFRR